MSYETYGPYIPVIMLITFLALFAWVLHPKNKKGFDEAAQIPFMDEEQDQATKREQASGSQTQREIEK